MSDSIPTPSPTIAAIASAPGRSERGIIRISGQDALVIASGLAEISFDSRVPRRYAAKILLGRLDEGGSKEAPNPELSTLNATQTEFLSHVATASTCQKVRVPADFYVWPTQRSFTGEPIVEIHTVGSPTVLNEILEMVLVQGARPAERGEFTLRAFLSGRIDLIQAEAVLGVIDAGNTDQLQTALRQLAGGISGNIAQIREELLLHLADLEAGLDFVEEDIDFVQREEFLKRVDDAIEFLSQLLSDSMDRMQSTGSYHVVLAGLPNAGKSTLFNALVQHEKAIVSEIAGTTRDYLSAEIEEAGLVYSLIDTAGWEQSRDTIEILAGNQRSEQYDRAELILWCQAADLDENLLSENDRLRKELLQTSQTVIVVVTKADQVDVIQMRDTDILFVSAAKGTNLSLLRDRIRESLGESNADADLLASSAARCRESLRSAYDALQRARVVIDQSAGDELVAMELRQVLDHLGRIVGMVYTDDILDRIFSRFCIGK